ncbi:gp3 tail completion and sheath stabilizer protein [Acinetobacter phage Acj9]|uniref:Gp3 tail completion and sheath stabilizer protein n=1 Tax=Acinetobacter phage Acj9 TaxID=760939 RepID=E5EPU0_9CAUD|nr:gp3 tail completion and sheath stabilizer protein [Acinetobacter phage Acj9]ADG60056.1 gp3 tail completion and sheath stabilizer protein [Acinetobacter phage Acj9]
MSAYNQTNKTNFAVDIPDAGITKAFVLNVSSALIPGISIPVTNMPTGQGGLGRANIPGSTFEFEPLVVRVLMDEDLQAWEDIYTWMLSINNYRTLYNEGWEPGVLPEFITLHIWNNSKTKILLSLHYYGAWPSTMGDLEFDFTDEGDPPVYANVTFQYKYFAVERNGVIIETRERIGDKLIRKK